MITKSELRREIRRRKSVLTAVAAPLYAERAFELVTMSPVYQEARVVLLYAALSDEVPTQTILDKTSGKTLLLPRVVGDELELRLYTSPDGLVESHDFHILEPTGPLFTDYAAIDLAVIPGMAFDAQGHRLGRGKGFYDKFLAHPDCRRLRKVGLCFDFQLLDTVPSDPHDIAVDDVITIVSTLD